MYQLKYILVVILILVCVKKAASILGAHHNSLSVCTTVVSYTNTRYVPYEETYKHKVFGLFYKTKTRVNYRTEYYQDWRLEKQCCPGYVGDGDYCNPVCEPKCVNSVCTKPNTCECWEHYAKSREAEGQDNVCTPICTNACVNGECVRPDACRCNEGYWMDSDGYTCKPSCEPDCAKGYGYCSAPGVCSCHPGYTVSATSIVELWRASENNKCLPYCGPSGCENGTCVQPYKCKCNDGYEPLQLDPTDLVKCVPKCRDGCANGDCVAPDTCQCHDGYARNNGNECVPVCSKPCVNGVCARPGVCICDQGYAHEFGQDPSVCFPVCEKKCVGGNCTAPNICTCPEGHVREILMEIIQCKPVCDVPCKYPAGYCSEPNVCTCYQGYQLVSPDKNSLDEPKSMCEPFCTVPCEANSSCTDPDTCTCDTGYEFSPSDNATVTCHPICEVNCGNGTCTSPNICSCDKGYETNENGTCVAQCSPPCDNGICVEPDTCECDDDFVLVNGTFCEPFCENCENGDCIAPSLCQCHDGFTDVGNETGSARCVMVCTRNCSEHGTCLYEGSACECQDGWGGFDCDQPTLCMLTIDANHISRERIQNLTQINGTQMDVYPGIPYCNECTDSIDNETTCFDFYSVDGNEGLTITCYLSTELPCYGAHKYSAVGNDSKLTGSIIAAIVFIALAVAVAGYLGYRRFRKRSLPAASVNDPQGSFLQGPAVTESLISEEGVYL